MEKKDYRTKQTTDNVQCLKCDKQWIKNKRVREGNGKLSIYSWDGEVVLQTNSARMVGESTPRAINKLTATLS